MKKIKTTLFYNPRCSKCRQALCFLQENDIKPEIIEYLKTPPTEKELSVILHKLGLKPKELIRTKEQLFIKKYKGKDYSDKDWMKVMCRNPELIERPILIEGDKAVIGRPPGKIFSIIKK